MNGLGCHGLESCRSRQRSSYHPNSQITKYLVFAAFVTTTLITCVSASAQLQTFQCTAPGGFGPVVAPFIPMTSLKTVPNPVLPNGPAGPVRDDLLEYIANQSAAIQLGKALFWEMQAGSDNKTACASCHFQAGADGRTRNQLNPGADNAWNAYAGIAPNYAFNPSGNDFPFTIPLNRDTDNIVGSQGVRLSTFKSISKAGVEATVSVPDPVYSFGGKNVRQVTGKNAPSVVNAVFNHRNFFNGRAQFDFNGVSPFGARDTARVWVAGTGGRPAQVDIHILNASLASQAVGPALNTVEMSASGRSFPDLGHKLLLVKPLALQQVSSTDSVLGPIADLSTGKGLTTSYTSLIQSAFQPKWWNASRRVTIGSKTYSMMEANFSLYWGLSIMLYEATLVANDSPIDQYLDSGRSNIAPLDQAAIQMQTDFQAVAPGRTLTSADILKGLDLFEQPVAPPPSFPVPGPGFGVGCSGCHVGAELTSASVRNLTGPGIEAGDAALKNAGFDLRMERMFMNLSWTPPGPLSPVPLGADAITFDPSNYRVNVVDIAGVLQNPPIALPSATYDTGWYNLGVRPTSEDLGVGANDPFGFPLSWTQLFQSLAPGSIKVPGNGLGCAGAGNATFPNTVLNASGFPLLSGPLLGSEPTDVAGTFKVASLRNSELTGPYFHNGGKSTLAQVINFYDDGGDFSNPTKAPAIVPLMLGQDQINQLVAFVVALTDDRVRWQRAPFDHPQLIVPNGDNPPGTDSPLVIPAVGAGGAAAPLPRFLNLNPFMQ
jgi:cytochrome c peroxidase